MVGFNQLRQRFAVYYYGVLEKAMKPLADKGITANEITFISCAVSLIAGFCYALGGIFLGGVLLLISGILDTLDGTLARITNSSSRFGALLDSSLDRYAEFFIFFGLIVYFRDRWILYVVMLALVGSVMVSYVRARAESLGKTRIVGLMQRPERLLLVVLGSFLNGPVGTHIPGCHDCPLLVTLIVLAVMTNVTVVHRILAGKRDLAESDTPERTVDERREACL